MSITVFSEKIDSDIVISVDSVNESSYSEWDDWRWTNGGWNNWGGSVWVDTAWSNWG